MPDLPPLSIHWFRRDLRITDNTALLAAAERGRVLPLYIASDWKGNHLWTGPKRQAFLCDCLASLEKNLETIGGKIVFRSGDAIEVLKQVLEESAADAIFTNRDPDPYGQEIEKKLAELCKDLGVAFHALEDVAMHDRDGVLKDDGDPYRVYTPYSRKWLAQDKAEPASKPKDLQTPPNIKTDSCPTLDHWGLTLEKDADILPGGEKAARKRLKDALEKVLSDYSETRDIPSLSGTSRLSQDLRFGTISIREVYAEAVKKKNMARSKESEDAIHTYIKELAWREFYFQILHHYPEVLEHEFNPSWRGLPWDEPGEQFEAWKEGRTGFPIIDAGIRQLLKTGFMHNRVRMIVAMFLTKDLHIDWRLGEQFFMQHLVDGEIAANNGGWQWSAGTGPDAAPYFRIQNPWTQSKRYDPKGTYIKKWCPELADLPAKLLFEAPKDGKAIADGYPAPMVDHSDERDRTLGIFKKHKEQQG